MSALDIFGDKSTKDVEPDEQDEDEEEDKDLDDDDDEKVE